MIDNLSLSTSWLSWRIPDVDAMVDEIKSYGFKQVELDFSLRKPAVDRFIELVDQKIISVSSVHNFCPIPDDPDIEYVSPDIFPISSANEDIRAKGVKYTFQTIDYAERLGARAVVVHSGKIPLKKDLSSKLMELLENGKQDSRKYLRTKIKLLKQRDKLRQEYMDYLLASFEKINEYAVLKGIKIGIENRFHVHEMPDIEEMDHILNTFKGGNLFYWHDIGHAQMMDNLGIFYHEEYVKFFKNRIAGTHIHDIVRTSDHRAPGTGAFEFERVRDFLSQDIIKVIEIHHPTSPKELENGILFLKKYYERINRHEEKNISDN
ncbi:MAG: sugar phosphate isomerase/epimerase family protein [Candidatus Auribacterota bacterium]